MKKLLLLCLLLTGIHWCYAQRPVDHSAACKEAMKKLAYFIGDWKGDVTYSRGNGSPQTINQTEHMEWRLDSTVLIMEGTGRQNNQIVFNAFAVLNYDAVANQFKFKSYLREGHSTDAYFTILKENTFEWGFDVQNGGKVRYTITLDPAAKTWHETGEYSRDGTTWMKTSELNLKKV